MRAHGGQQATASEMAKEKEQNEEGHVGCFHAPSQKGEMGLVAPLSHPQS